jgi:hypothetical protein
VRLHLQYYCNLSLEYDENSRWEGLTRQDMTRARIKAKRHRARMASSTKSSQTPKRIHKPIGPARRRERARRRAKRRGETLIEPKDAALSHLERLLRHAAKAIPSPQLIPTETRPQPLHIVAEPARDSLPTNAEIVYAENQPMDQEPGGLPDPAFACNSSCAALTRYASSIQRIASSSRFHSVRELRCRRNSASATRTTRATENHPA